MELVYSQSGADGLLRTDRATARQYLAEARPDVNEVGLDGLLRYAIWLAWHDGWLRPERT